MYGWGLGGGLWGCMFGGGGWGESLRGVCMCVGVWGVFGVGVRGSIKGGIRYYRGSVTALVPHNVQPQRFLLLHAIGEDLSVSLKALSLLATMGSGFICYVYCGQLEETSKFTGWSLSLLLV